MKGVNERGGKEENEDTRIKSDREGTEEGETNGRGGKRTDERGKVDHEPRMCQQHTNAVETSRPKALPPSNR